MNCNYLFIYGTLMKELRSNLFFDFENYLSFIGKAYYYGKLFEIRDYPGVIPSSNKKDKVYGEVYEIIDMNFVENHLDEYEGYGLKFAGQEEYIRTMVYVHMKNYSRKRCWIYLYNRPIHHYQRIIDGKYDDFKRNRIQL